MDRLLDGRRERMASLLDAVAHGDFYLGTRRVQVIRMVLLRKDHGVTQVDIAAVLNVSDSHVSKIKADFLARGDEVTRPPWKTDRPA